jgi:hypothetical protein
MPARSTVNEVLSCLANNGLDEDGLFAADWFHRLEKYDLLSELVTLICKNRKLKEYQPLVDHIEACIEAEQAEMP